MRTGAARRRRFIAVAVALPFAVVACVEIALRVGGYGGRAREVPLRFMNRERKYADDPSGPLMPDADRFWRLRPGGASPGGGGPIPASGFRTAFDEAKAPGVRRVVCLGDSNTFGLGVPAERTWPAHVARGLVAARPAEKWEVLNLGVPGYTSWQVRRLLECDVAAMSPDVVVIETGGFNDWVPAVGAADREQGRAVSASSLRVVELLASVFAPSASPDEHPRNSLSDLATADYAGPRRVPLADFEDDLRAIAAWCAAHGARAVFIAHPLPELTVSRNPIALQYGDAVRRVAAETGAALADGWAAFKASGAGEAELFRDFCHPTDRGYEVIAPAVLEAMPR